MLQRKQKWVGPGCCCAGILLLVAQVYIYLSASVLFALLLGGGVGLLVIGALAWFYYLDDLRSGAKIEVKEEPLTADEFDQYFNEIRPDDTGLNDPRGG
jgi:hypothetical protein